jgi:hypothetical protein
LKKNLIIFIIILISNAFNIPKEHILNNKDTPSIELSKGDTKRGQYIFSKYIRFDCNISYIKFAILHTQDEWEEIAQAGKFEEEIFKICPKIKTDYKSEWTPHLYQFAYEYAIDSGNIPFY